MRLGLIQSVLTVMKAVDRSPSLILLGIATVENDDFTSLLKSFLSDDWGEIGFLIKATHLPC
ncbi:hypothetical protein EA456_01005 [Streptococcus dysgalactiae subsp. dysgalactiae]|nr:hypothetical protein SDE12394_10145 [Streptococcus dysgalactiae subsp. equisimilis ATCC 12394]KKC17849.1 hypothetical protein WH14_08300 [Streptococcus dysgalactiae subsp. equisimilis]OCX08375.1 hypothetical protein GCS_05055 [Streptococcus dysgalactiae subsp. equisimilis AKSDE4288]QFZ10315.1 hypothetical protein EBL83_08795 [Streptococcus dysgalactiae]QGG99201.1 hypothetical protein EA456_01005 [Streptococcus dysgalactiae subsp. dysgalactiae]BAN94483.1 hypothetical protein SDSE167_2108 [St